MGRAADYQILQYERQSLHNVNGSNHHHCKSGRVCVTVVEILAGFLGIHFAERCRYPGLPNTKHPIIKDVLFKDIKDKHTAVHIT